VRAPSGSGHGGAHRPRVFATAEAPVNSPYSDRELKDSGERGDEMVIAVRRSGWGSGRDKQATSRHAEDAELAPIPSASVATAAGRNVQRARCVRRGGSRVAGPPTSRLIASATGLHQSIAAGRRSQNLPYFFFRYRRPSSLPCSLPPEEPLLCSHACEGCPRHGGSASGVHAVMMSLSWAPRQAPFHLREGNVVVALELPLLVSAARASPGRTGFRASPAAWRVVRGSSWFRLRKLAGQGEDQRTAGHQAQYSGGQRLMRISRRRSRVRKNLTDSKSANSFSGFG